MAKQQPVVGEGTVNVSEVNEADPSGGRIIVKRLAGAKAKPIDMKKAILAEVYEVVCGTIGPLKPGGDGFSYGDLLDRKDLEGYDIARLVETRSIQPYTEPDTYATIEE